MYATYSYLRLTNPYSITITHVTSVSYLQLFHLGPQCFHVSSTCPRACPPHNLLESAHLSDEVQLRTTLVRVSHLHAPLQLLQFPEDLVGGWSLRGIVVKAAFHEDHQWMARPDLLVEELDILSATFHLRKGEEPVRVLRITLVWFQQVVGEHLQCASAVRASNYQFL